MPTDIEQNGQYSYIEAHGDKLVLLHQDYPMPIIESNKNMYAMHVYC